MNNLLRHAGALTALLAGALATGVNAGQPTRLADPAAAAAPVPATRYESRELAPVVTEPTSSPPQNWTALNRLVGSYDSMSLTMDSPEAKPVESMRAEKAPETPSPAGGSQQPSAPALAPDPHAHHKQGAVK